ncbi:MAG: NAD(P)/FAD-dependent oxidoreductase [Pyrinomonadaceae bacterium]
MSVITTTSRLVSARQTKAAPKGAPDLSYFRRHYPLTVTHFGGLAEREAHLRRVWELDARWQESLGGQKTSAEEVIVRSAPPAHLVCEGEFEIVYAGGVLGLLHAAVMACRYGRRVLVLDAHAVGRTHRDWNISDEELREFERAGLFTKEEIERAVVNRYRAGFVKFHDKGSRVKAPPLWMNHVLDVAIEADQLLALAAEKIRAQGPPECALLDGLRFVRAYVEPDRVSVEVEDGRGRRRLFAARLFVDATGTNSPVARQLNGGRALTHVCPTVGTVARGFARGEGPDRVDFGVGEILVSTEGVSENRQLIWEGFAGSPARDEYTTYLFFYDAVDSPADKSLLALFERYFASLPSYKRAGAQWRVVKPVFGYIPSVHRQGWKDQRKRTADDRVLTVGDAAGLSSPLTFCGFGSHVRNLRRLTHLTELALAANLLDAGSLSEVSAYEPRVAQMSSLAEFLRPAPKGGGDASQVNETLNAVMAALHGLDERVRRQLFQDRMTFGALKSLLGRTAQLYPRIFQRVRDHLGARGTLWWIAGIAEAAFSERRARRAADAPEALSDETETTPAAEFAHHVARYQKERGAEG